MTSGEKNQNTFDFEPDYMEEQGAKYAFTGRIYTPAPGEAEKFKRSQELATAKHEHDVWRSLMESKVTVTQSVRIRPLEALKFRAKGQ